MNSKETEAYICKKFDVRSDDSPPYTGWDNYVTREHLYDLFKELNYSYGAEIGVLRGENAFEMLNRIPNLKLICVDPWIRYERNYQKAKHLLRDYDVIWKRTTSMKAAKTIEDGSLDFVYIDALHNFDNVMMDLIYWVPKVKRGGIVSGHDYYYSQTCHVPKAVDAYTFAHGFYNLHLTRDNISNGKFPFSPSWFWVK